MSSNDSHKREAKLERRQKLSHQLMCTRFCEKGRVRYATCLALLPALAKRNVKPKIVGRAGDDRQTQGGIATHAAVHRPIVVALGKLIAAAKEEGKPKLRIFPKS